MLGRRGIECSHISSSQDDDSLRSSNLRGTAMGKFLTIGRSKGANWLLRIVLPAFLMMSADAGLAQGSAQWGLPSNASRAQQEER